MKSNSSSSSSRRKNIKLHGKHDKWWRWRMRKCAWKKANEHFIIIIITEVSVQEEDLTNSHKIGILISAGVHFVFPFARFPSTLLYICYQIGIQITFHLIKRQLCVCRFICEERVLRIDRCSCSGIVRICCQTSFTHLFRIQPVIVVQSIKIFTLISLPSFCKIRFRSGY